MPRFALNNDSVFGAASSPPHLSRSRPRSLQVQLTPQPHVFPALPTRSARLVVGLVGPQQPEVIPPSCGAVFGIPDAETHGPSRPAGRCTA